MYSLFPPSSSLFCVLLYMYLCSTSQNAALNCQGNIKITWGLLSCFCLRMAFCCNKKLIFCLGKGMGQQLGVFFFFYMDEFGLLTLILFIYFKRMQHRQPELDVKTLCPTPLVNLIKYQNLLSNNVIKRFLWVRKSTILYHTPDAPV